MVAKNAPKTEVSRWTPSREDLESLTSLEDFQALMRANGRELVKVEELESLQSFKVVDKKSLVGRPFVILHWRERVDETRNTSYAVVSCMTASGEKVLFTDGSTGVYKQLSSLYEKDGIDCGIICERGLSVSTYTVTNPATGAEEPAKTYYLAI